MKICWRNSFPSTLLAAGFLVALSAGVGWPILAGDGLWYLDNPAHLAETLERANSGGGGWSDLAFCGFPLGQWHSPAAYGALAVLVRMGMPLERVYGAALWISFAFPALVLFAGARKRLGTGGAILLASVLLLQPPALVGIESAWGGMWTFYLAAGGWLWLLQRWSTGRGGLAGDAALIGAIGLTHLFVLAAVPLLAFCGILFPLRHPCGPGRSAARIAGACLLGAWASMALWWPAGAAQWGGGWTPQNLPPGRLIWALAVPADMQILTSAAPIAWQECAQPGVLPMLALLFLGIGGGLLRTGSAGSRPGRLGFAFALALLALLLGLPWLPAGLDRVLGPVSWRLLYLVRLGLAWSALEACASARGRPPPNSRLIYRWIFAGLLLVVLGGWISDPLRKAVRDSGQRAHREVQALWAAIRSSTVPGDSGRIYVQDTYQNPDIPAGLARNSHVLAFTAAATGIRQLGAYYGMAPQTTAEWTSGEFGRLCGVEANDSRAVPAVRERLQRGQCTQVAVVSKAWADRLAGQSGFFREYQSEWFTLFRVDNPGSNGVEILSGAGRAAVQHPRPGLATIEYAASAPGGAIRISQAWHPDWKVVDGGSLRFGTDETGLMRVEGLPAGEHVLHLQYAPPAWPVWATWTAWMGLALQGGRHMLLRRKRMEGRRE